MRRLAGLAAAALALAESEKNAQYEVEERPSVMHYGDTRKAARNHHRRMRASGRHNWRTSK